jgi:uncharacterized lipoprotein YddW (UPF0748 family)
MAAVLLTLTALSGASTAELPTFGMWAHASQAATRADADALLDSVHAARVDALYVLVWYWGGHAYYVTDLAPLADKIEPGYDPLGYLVEGCHKRGMEIHAWYVNGEVGSPAPGAVLAAHPDWAMVDAAGNPVSWYDLGKPEVRRFQSDLMVDALRRYDLDGVHFDYIRHNGRATCYCPSCIAAFEKQTALKVADFQPNALPATLYVSANPLAEPTTAQALARFSNGTPAIYLNALGRGRVLGLNYHAEDLRDGFAAEAVKRFLSGVAADGEIPVVFPPETARDYARSMADDLARALQSLGRKARVVAGLGEAPANGAAALACAYRVSEPLAQELVDWVEAGGLLIVIDGPVFSVGLEPLKRLTGMARAGNYFSGQTVIRPDARSDLIPIREGHEVSADDLARFEQAWTRFQMDGPTALVRDVYQRAHALRPKAKVTAAVFHNRAAADSVYQDWYGWLREGIIDYVIPMCYVMKAEDLEAGLDEWQVADPTLERIMPGLSIYQRVDGTTGPRPPELVTDQVNRCLERGAHRVVFFSAHSLSPDLTEALASYKR